MTSDNLQTIRKLLNDLGYFPFEVAIDLLITLKDLLRPDELECVRAHRQWTETAYTRRMLILSDAFALLHELEQRMSDDTLR